MKTAISIPDHVFADAERLAKKLRKSRSQLYSEAVAEYVARRDGDAITKSINDVIDEFGHEPDEFVIEAGKRTLRRAEW
jgi:predicted transcriptional regulator